MEYENKNYSRKILHSFEMLRRGDALSDVELKSGDTAIMAHRVLLAAACPYFEAMFTSGLRESRRASVCLPTVPPHILTLILDYIYTGRVSMSDSAVQDLIVAADMLQLEELVTACAAHLKENLEPSNALGVYRFAEAHNWTGLARDAMRYAVTHLSAVAEGQELLDLPLAVLLRLMSSDESEEKDETAVLCAGVRWLEHDPSRSSHALQVLRRVRLSRVPSSSLQDTLNTIRDPVVFETLDAFIAVLEPVESDGTGKTRPHLYIIGGCSMSGSLTELKYDIYKRSWEKIAPMRKFRYGCAVAAMGGLLYAVGGMVKQRMLDTGEVYDPATNRWSNISLMHMPRSFFGLVALSGKLYAFGGNDETDGLVSSVEEYNTVTDRWSSIGVMPERRRDMSVVGYKGAAYVVGGQVWSGDGWEESADLLRFEPTRGEWRRLAPMVHKRHGAPAVLDVKGMHLYVLGGHCAKQYLDVVERYNFVKDKWEEVERMREVRYLCAAGAAEGVLIAAGGHDSNGRESASVELYEVAQRRWTEGAPIPQPRKCAASAVIWTLPQMASAAAACLSEFMERVPAATPEDQHRG